MVQCAPHGEVQRTTGREEVPGAPVESWRPGFNKEPMGTIGVTTREPTVAAGGFPGEGDKRNGDKHEESRTVNTTRGTVWDGIRTAIAVTRG